MGNLSGELEDFARVLGLVIKCHAVNLSAIERQEAKLQIEVGLRRRIITIQSPVTIRHNRTFNYKATLIEKADPGKEAMK